MKFIGVTVAFLATSLFSHAILAIPTPKPSVATAIDGTTSPNPPTYEAIDVMDNLKTLVTDLGPVSGGFWTRKLGKRVLCDDGCTGPCG